MKKAQITVNTLGRKGLDREGEGRRTPRPSFFAKRRLKSQLRRIFAELLGSIRMGSVHKKEKPCPTHPSFYVALSTEPVKACRSKPLAKKKRYRDRGASFRVGGWG